jgi:hypothetical protein
MSMTRGRSGFTLLDVAFATIIMTIGTMFVGRYFATVYDRLSPRANGSGLRRYVVAEQCLRGEAEGLRLLTTIPADAGSCRLVAPAASTGFTLTVNQFRGPNSPDANNAELYYFDLGITSDTGATVAKLSISTLRSTTGGQDAKIGL